jgi:hypothetical protein
MSSEYPMFVFVGTDTRRAELELIAANRDWYIYEAQDDALYGTLAQVVAFFPDAVVIEDTGDLMLHETVMHLNSIHFEPLIILSDSPELWRTDAGARVAVLPRDTTPYEVLDAVRAHMEDAEPVWA